MSDRQYFGKENEVVFPISINSKELPSGYSSFISEIKEQIKKERYKVILQANRSMIILYWNIGKMILAKQEIENRGSKIIDRVSKDLKEEFPEMSGFSPRNLKYMRKFALVWRDEEFVQQVVAQIPWRTNIVLLDKLNDNKSREWYAKKVINMVGVVMFYNYKFIQI